ncbi:MAG: DNA starvation/stationary phase protection protein [Planctomycetota bacterium]
MTPSDQEGSEMNPFKRSLLGDETTHEIAKLMQANLADLVDAALLLKQAHWNVTGKHFQPVHEQLDEVVETLRGAGDDVAERIATLGASPDGRSHSVSAESRLASFPAGFHSTESTVTAVADALKVLIEGLRESIEPMGDLDPISEDLLIGITAEIEKHFWMLQAQEVSQ